jgi:hypothetical protein
MATVATAGIFTLPPTKAYDANQPELLGLSAGFFFLFASFFLFLFVFVAFMLVRLSVVCSHS